MSTAQERAARAALHPHTGHVTVAPLAAPTAGEAPSAAPTLAAPSRLGASPAADWWADHDNLAALWSWLEDRVQEPDSVVYFLEKPWKWTPEYVDMRDEQERPL
jgi:hypothetical protein